MTKALAERRVRWPGRSAAREATALFLDVDGTLLELAPTPSEVKATGETIELLSSLQRTLGGAIALLSGRSIEDLDRIFFPLKLPCAGAHGAERRTFDGTRHRAATDQGFLAHARIALRDLAERHRGTILEDKGVALAFHVRLSPRAAPEAAQLVTSLAESSAGRYRVQRGKEVFELKPACADKGSALIEFLAEPPFRNRLPWVAGDDLTDADAFRAAEARRGISIGVGKDAPDSMFRLHDTSQCRRWLASFAESLEPA